MSENKTKPTKVSINRFLNDVDEMQRKDSYAILDIMKKIIKEEPVMWGQSMIGFGKYHYKYESGREGSAPLVGMASRANAITLYLPLNFDKREELLSRFGKHKTGKGCIYIQKLEDIDKGILSKMVKNSIEYRKKQHPG